MHLGLYGPSCHSPSSPLCQSQFMPIHSSKNSSERKSKTLPTSGMCLAKLFFWLHSIQDLSPLTRTESTLCSESMEC